MTIAKPKHLEARALLLKHLDLHPGKAVNNDLDPLEAGIVPDSNHRGGYHCGRGQVDATDYSVRESSRDRNGLDQYSAGIDYGYFAVTTDRGTFDLYDYNLWLKGLWDAGDDDTKDLREVIYSPDGVNVRRLDKLGIRSTGDSSHQTHTHHSEFRDADGHRMVNLARRWLQHIGLLEDPVTKDEIAAIAKETAKQVWATPYGNSSTEKRWPGAGVKPMNSYLALAAMYGKDDLDTDDVDEQAIVAGVLAGLDAETIAAAIPAEIAEQVAQKLADRMAA
jgi:hypothetical protein